MADKKTVQRIENVDHIDGQTGEILGTDIRVQTFQHEIEPPYVKLYTQDIGRLYGLTESTQHVLMALAKHMVYKTNVIVLYGPIKTILMQELGMNRNTFNKAIDTLYKEGILIRQSRACYVLDPELFGSGSWADVKRVRLSIDYHPDGSKSFKTQLVKENAVVSIEKKGWRRKQGDLLHEQLQLNFDQVPGVFGEDSYESPQKAVNSIDGSLPFQGETANEATVDDPEANGVGLDGHPWK